VPVVVRGVLLRLETDGVLGVVAGVPAGTGATSTVGVAVESIISAAGSAAAACM
jgi:hypothetical protein